MSLLQKLVVPVVPAVAAALILGASATAQLAWEPAASAAHPAPRWGHAVARFGTLFGGRDATQAFADTWYFDNFGWHLLQTGVAPSPRHGHAMQWTAFGALLFGGADVADVANAETWLFNSVAWQLVPTAHAPSPRADHAMMTDSTWTIHLFGGLTAAGASDEHWRFENGDWHAVPAGRRPAARHGHVMLTSGTGRPVVVGGTDGVAVFDDVWEFDGVDWNQIGTAPVAATGVAAARLGFERWRDVFVGGTGAQAQPLDDLRERGIDGTWFEHAPLGSLRARSDAAVFERVVCTPTTVVTTAVAFGGRNANGVALGDTWLLAPTHPATVEFAGTSCGPGAPGNVGPYLSLPMLVRGNTGDVRVFARPAAFVLLGVQLGDTAAAPACGITIQPHVVLAAISDGNHLASFPLAVPFSPLLQGAALSMQAIAIEPGVANSLAISRLGVLRLGD